MAPVVTPVTPTSTTMALPQPGTQQPSSLSRLTLSDKLLLSQAVHHIGTSPPDWGRVSSVLLSHPLIKTKVRLEQAAKAGITLGRVFGSRECERAWVALMRQYNLVLQPGERDASLENTSASSYADGDSSAQAAQLSPTASMAPLLPVVSNSTVGSTSMAQSSSSQGSVPATTPGGTPATPRTKEARGFPPRMDRPSQLALAQFLYAERILEIQNSIKAKEIAFKAIASEIEALQSGSVDDKLLDEIEKSTPGQEQALVEQTSKELAAIEGIIHSPPMMPAPSSTSAPVRGRISRGGSVTNLPIVSPTRPLPMPDLRLPQATSPTNTFNKSAEKDAVSTTPERSEEVETGSQKDAEVSAAVESAETASIPPEEAVASAEDDKNVAEDITSPKPAEEIEIEPVTAQTHAGEELPSDDKSVGLDDTVKSKRKRDAESVAEDQEEDAKRQRTSDHQSPETNAVQLAERADAETVAAAVASEDSVSARTGADNIDEQGARKSEAEQTKEPATKESPSPDHVAEDGSATAPMDTEMPEVDEEEIGSETSRRPEIRRSRRSARNLESDDQATPTPPYSATLKKNRVEVLRSRQASGTSLDEEEQEGETQEAESSRSTLEPAERTSMSPAAGRRPRLTGRRSSVTGNTRKGRRSSTSATAHGDDTTSDVERERERAAQAAQQRKDEKVLMMLLNEVSNHTHGNLFHAAIRESDAPDYYALIRHPLDLKTIKARIKEGRITTAMQLRRALNQMFANSLIYNRPGTEVHRMALEMRDAAEQMLDQFEQTQRSAKSRR